MPYKDPEKKKEYDKKYLKENKEKHREASLRYSRKNREKLLIKNKEYRESNEEQCRKRVSSWSKRNSWRKAALAAKRRAAVLFSTPLWADLLLIQSIYRSCPKGYHVDHIVPLQGDNVCGLHVPYNLQYLPALENLRKSNSLHN